MRYPNKKGHNTSLTEKQKEFIKEHGLSNTDNEIAIELSVSVGVVHYYRREILGLVKAETGRPYKKPNNVRNLFEISNELRAIQRFANFPSFMNGAKDRAKYLESVLNQVR